MRNSYIARAEKFMKSFLAMTGIDLSNIDEVKRSVELYNAHYHRAVIFEHGISRMVLITSDYVIKWDYSSYGVEEFGGCENELAFYEYAKEKGYSHLLAKITRFEVDGIFFYVMPRIRNIGYLSHKYSIYGYCSEDEGKWLLENIGDLHDGNWGLKKNKVVIIDYAAID